MKKKSDLFENAWTVPNALTVLRIILIPVFAVLFYQEKFIWAFSVLFVSGTTDFLDGKIARRFNQISALGKLLDPVADKLTQITIAVMLFFEFQKASSGTMKAFSWVFLFFLVKEGIMIVGGAIMLAKGIRPGAAEIYGKIATLMFYVVMLLVVAFGPEVGAFVRANPDLALPESVTMVLVVLSAVMTFVALLSYVPETFRQFRENKKNEGAPAAK
ncbi:MAG: CDP-alcohol phosphatidyltransferase family protein [Oscillospiraceae bacterium]|nr:CDP-alcohol phosphatidyltransferase family protein [Oscillospiraceae bacterium]